MEYKEKSKQWQIKFEKKAAFELWREVNVMKNLTWCKKLTWWKTIKLEKKAKAIALGTCNKIKVMKN